MNGRRALFLLGAALLLAAAAGFALFRDEPPAAAPEPPAREDASPSEERGAIPDPALREEARAPEPAASAAEEPSPVPETRPAPRGPGIQGIVVDAESGAPVPGALVTAYELDAEFAADGDTGLHETVAGAGGSFLLAGPFQPGGGVLLSASANGWRSPFPYASVRMGQSDLVQQVIRVVRAPSLAGRVLDPERRGVRAVIEVRARDRWFCCVESGEDGTFLLDDVAGRLDLWSATRETPIHVWAEHEAFRQGAATTTLADVLAERPVEIVLERGAALAGRALDLAGGPITGARMRCYPLNDDRFSRVRETETGQDGSFRVAGLGAGPHRLEPAARAGALAPARRCLVLDLAEQEERPGIEVLYLPGHSLGGQARDRSDETPLAGRLVTLHHSDWLDPLETLTDHAGRFLFPAVSEGDYTVVLRGASWSDPVEPVIETNVPAGRTDILLEADVEPRDGSLHLALRDAESGRPLSGSVFVELRWSRHGLLEQRAERLQAGAEGSVSLPLLERTRYWLEAAAPGFAPAARTFELSEARPEARLEIGLRRPISISGRVTDGAGRPIERARVKALAEPRGADLLPGMGAPTDSAGRFTLDDAPPDAALVAAAAPGFAPAALELAPYGGLLSSVHIVLYPGATVDGVLLRPDGTPARALTLVLLGPVAVHYADTDDQGRFVFENVEDGGFLLGLPQGGAALASGTIAAAAGQSLEVFLD